MGSRARELLLMGSFALGGAAIVDCSGSSTARNPTRRHEDAGSDATTGGRSSSGGAPTTGGRNATGGVDSGGTGGVEDASVGDGGAATSPEASVEAGRPDARAACVPAPGADAAPPRGCTGVLSDVLGHWPLDDVAAGITPDVGPLHMGGVVTGAVGVPGRIGQALTFNGQSYVTVDDRRVDLPGAVSMSAWARPTASNFSWQSIVGVSSIGTNLDSYWLGYYVGSVRVHYTDGVNDYGLLDTVDHSAQLGQWHHVAATYDPCTRHTALYFDGVLASEADDTGPHRLGYDGAPLRIGSDTNLNAIAFTFTGDIDEVKVFACTLDAEQIARDFAANSPFAD